MQKIDLRRLDLNLLLVFQAIMRERSVSRAAEDLGRTQPAISHALERLRLQLKDPLLVKGDKGMTPTPYALALEEALGPIMGRLEQALALRAPFDPASSDRVFRLAAPDFALSIFIDVIGAARREAPGARLSWTGLSENLMRDLLEDRLDLALGPAALPAPQGVARDILGDISWRCYMRRDHPALAQWGAETWSRWPHVVVKVGDRLTGPVDEAAKAAGLERRIGAWAPHFSAVAPLLEATDFIATLPDIAMRDSLARYDLAARPAPLALPPMRQALFWSGAEAMDEGLIWLRGLMRAALGRALAPWRATLNH